MAVHSLAEFKYPINSRVAVNAIVECGSERKAARHLFCCQYYLHKLIPDVDTIYFLESSGLVKIGTAKKGNLPTRIVTIKMMNSSPVYLIGFMEGGKELERQLHARWKEWRHHGEWFTFSDEIKQFVAEELNNAIS